MNTTATISETTGNIYVNITRNGVAYTTIAMPHVKRGRAKANARLALFRELEQYPENTRATVKLAAVVYDGPEYLGTVTNDLSETASLYVDKHGRTWRTINRRPIPISQFVDFLNIFDNLWLQSFRAGCGMDRANRFDALGRRTKHGKWMDEHEDALMFKHGITRID